MKHIQKIALVLAVFFMACIAVIPIPMGGEYRVRCRNPYGTGQFQPTGRKSQTLGRQYPHRAGH